MQGVAGNEFGNVLHGQCSLPATQFRGRPVHLSHAVRHRPGRHGVPQPHPVSVPIFVKGSPGLDQGLNARRGNAQQPWE